MHWMVDYCMATLSTDDEIAAGPCIEQERLRTHSDDCAAKFHYKSANCELAVARGRAGAVADCVDDASFTGSTVRAGGVGG